MLQKVEDIPMKKSWKHRETIKKSLWFTAMSKNAITLLLACLLTQFLTSFYGKVPYNLSGKNQLKDCNSKGIGWIRSAYGLHQNKLKTIPQDSPL